MFKSFLLGWRGVILATFCVVVIAVSAYLISHPERTFLLPRHVPPFYAPRGLSPQPYLNPLNPFRDRGPEREAREIIAAAKRGDCEGEIWSRVSLAPEEEPEAYYKVSRKAELCKDFASAEIWILDYVYTPEKAYLLFGSQGLKPTLGKPAPLVGVELRRINGQWRIIKFSIDEEGFRIE